MGFPLERVGPGKWLYEKDDLRIEITKRSVGCFWKTSFKGKVTGDYAESKKRALSAALRAVGELNVSV